MAEVISPHMADLETTRARIRSFFYDIDTRNGVDTISIDTAIAQRRQQRKWNESDHRRIQALSALVLESQLQTAILAV